MGEVVSNHNILTYLAFLSVALVWFFINRTKLGIRIRAVGENPKAAESVGINIIRTQVTALLICGFLASLGGMYLSMGYVSWFSRDMVSGRGWIALAAEAMGQRGAIGTAATSLLFGVTDALSNAVATLGWPSDLVKTIPYCATLAGLAIFSIRAFRRARNA